MRVTSREPILIVTATLGGFGEYLGEMLKTEGLNAFESRKLASVDAALLRLYDVVILMESILSVPQANMFSEFVDDGGRLIGIRPDPALAGLFGLAAAPGVTADGYVRFNTGSPVGRGLVSDTLQIHGDADHYTNLDAGIAASLYADAATATAFPAVAQKNRAVIFAYNLARSVALTRQGNPARANIEGDGVTGLRPSDAFGSVLPDDPFTWLDFTKRHLPQADLQMRALTNAIGAVSLLPLPRLWYFPRGARSALVMTGDQNGASVTQMQDEVDAVEAEGGHLTYYLVLAEDGTNWTPNADRELDWLLRGHSTGVHLEHGSPLGQHSCGGANPLSGNALSQRIAEQTEDFAATFGHSSRTLRAACLSWRGWVEEASPLADHGVRMDLDYVSLWFATEFGRVVSAITQSSLPYMTGSGLPMRFVEEHGRVVDAYLQPTQFEDDVIRDIQESPLGSGNFTTFTTNLIVAALDDAVDRFHESITLNIHPTAFASYSGDATRNVLAHARSRGVPILSADDWLEFWEGRERARASDITLDGERLTFTLNVPSGLTDLTVLLPFRHDGRRIESVHHGRRPYPYRLIRIGATDYAAFEVGGGDHAFAARYARTMLRSFPNFVRAGGTPRAQWASPLDFTVTVRTKNLLKVQYDVASTHTSNIGVVVLVDGIRRHRVGPLGPPSLARRAGTDMLDVAAGPGEHTITLRPIGIRGGGNTGTLNSWGGTLLVHVS